eukprot:m.25755 g.25755  ORF g.25755 m.25755 type:complete len:424 (-) comp7736_c0_seq1:21-1292(-)
MDTSYLLPSDAEPTYDRASVSSAGAESSTSSSTLRHRNRTLTHEGVSLASDGKWFSRGVTYDKKHIVRYDEKRIYRFFVFTFGGSVFDIKQQRATWIQGFVLLLIAAIVAVATVYETNVPEQHNTTESSTASNDAWAYLQQTSVTINALVVFLLGFHTADVKTRWWALRIALERIQGHVTAIALLCSTFLPHKERITETIIRYGMTCHDLMWVDNAPSGGGDLSGLISRGALTEAEAAELRNNTNRVTILLEWIMMLLHKEYSDPEQTELSDLFMDKFFDVAEEIRQGCQTISTHLRTQMPFPYVHLLSVMVKLALLTMAIESGPDAAYAYIQGRYSWVLISALKLLIMNFFYQGLLELQVILSNPFGDHPAHFPHFTFQKALESNCRSVIAQRRWRGGDGSQMPPFLQKLAESSKTSTLRKE